MTRKTYAVEFKEKAANYVISSNKPIAQVARELGVAVMITVPMTANVTAASVSLCLNSSLANRELRKGQIKRAKIVANPERIQEELYSTASFHV